MWNDELPEIPDLPEFPTRQQWIDSTPHSLSLTRRFLRGRAPPRSDTLTAVDDALQLLEQSVADFREQRGAGNSLPEVALRMEAVVLDLHRVSSALDAWTRENPGRNPAATADLRSRLDAAGPFEQHFHGVAAALRASTPSTLTLPPYSLRGSPDSSQAQLAALPLPPGLPGPPDYAPPEGPPPPYPHPSPHHLAPPAAGPPGRRSPRPQGSEPPSRPRSPGRSR